MLRFNGCRTGSLNGVGKVGYVMFGSICFLVCLITLSTVAVAAEKGPIKIGFVAPLTGNFAQIGLDMVEGFKMFWAENNNMVAGRKVEIIVEDEAGVPGVAIAKVRKLINHDKVNLITAGSLDSCVTAFSLPAQDANKPTDTIPAINKLLILIRF